MSVTGRLRGETRAEETEESRRAPARGRRVPAGDAREDDRTEPGAPRRDAAEVRERQHEEFGGINWGSAFFGWLVAVGVGAILTGLLSATGAAIGFSTDDAESVGLAGAIGLLVIAFISYLAGGYVAGRMSRFDGARQGLGVFAWAIIAAIVLAIIGAVAGSEYNVFGGLDLPRIPIDEGTLAGGAAITLAAIVLAMVIGAVAGGKLGERYHRRVDRVGFGR